MISEDPTWVESTSERKTLQGVTRVGYQALLRVKLDLTPLMPGCYVCCVLVEVRKQGVAGRMFRGTSEACAKGAAGDSAEVAVGSPAEAVGGQG